MAQVSGLRCFVRVTTDSTGFTSFPSSSSSHQGSLSAFGAPMKYSPADRLSLELKGSAFGIPHHVRP
ncbi:MAG TPA: hypothetical protein VKT81_23510 [Bryobacteraceae bacterium]|nr:hypothetical protein [Bryobacteraceae bacterium]